MKTHNFLDFWNKKKKKDFWTAILTFALILIPLILIWTASPVIAIFLVFALITGLFVVKLQWGVYFLALFAFFQGLEINFSNLSWTKNTPFLNQLNAPLIDFFATFLLFSFIVAWGFRFVSLKGKKFRDKFPGIFLYGPFIFTSLISLIYIYNNLFAVGFKYILRPMLFVYVAFVLIPYQLIRKRKTVYNIIKLWVFLGIIIALFGFSSLFVVSKGLWARLVPYAIGGFAPLGYNHNSIAEIMVVVFPFSVFLYFINKHKQTRSFLLVATFLIILAGLLTLSRAGWIALGIETLLISWFARSSLLSFWKKVSFTLKTAVFLIFGAVFLYMGVFLTSSVVESSTTARAEAINVATFYITRKPLFGYGPGTFMYVLSDTEFFVSEFGQPLDAHGLLQKILMEEGAVGLVFFLAFIFWVFWRLHKKQKNTNFIRKRKMLYQSLFVSVLGIVIFQLFSTSYFNAVVWLPLGIALTSTYKLKVK
jgi:O-antigen ligase